MQAPFDSPLRRALVPPLALGLFMGGCDVSDGLDGELEEPAALELVEDLPDPVERDWDAIRQRDTLVALVTSNSTSYFVYRGEAMGFEFRLLRAFAEDHDLALKTRVVRDRTELFRLLNEGEGDVVGARLVPLDPYAEHVRFSRPLYRTEGVLVQRDAAPESAAEALPEPVDTIIEKAGAASTPRSEAETPTEPVEVRARLVQRPSQLADDRVVLSRGSEYYLGLVELSDTIEGTIEVVELESARSVEPLLRRVSRGELDLVVAPENVAELKDESFTNLTLQPTVVASHPVAWAVRENAPELQAALDAWLSENQGRVEETYQRFFVDRAGYREREESEYLTSETGSLSEYDTLLARAAVDIGWDWRLLASQAYQESKFDATARSWAGAQGLLQLMPATAREVGVADAYDPEQNVEGAVRYLDWLEGQWAPEVPDPDERLRFVLASYNAGRGHVMDAQRLAEKNGDDPMKWDDVAYWLLQKSKRQYYTDPVVRYGYCRGLEPVTYVALILERFDHYREFVEGEPLGGEAVTAAETD